MIISLLDEIGKYSENASSEQLREKLLTHGISIFEPIYNQTEKQGEGEEEIVKTKFTGQTPKYIILYILYAYSEDSPYLVLGSNPEKEKEAIIEKLQIPELWHNMLINLEDKSVRDAALDYISTYATPLWFRDFQILRIQHSDAAIRIAKGITKYNKDTEEYEPDEAGQSRAVKNYEDFGKRLQKMEDDIRNQVGSQMKFLNSLAEDMTARKGGRAISWENTLKIK